MHDVESDSDPRGDGGNEGGKKDSHLEQVELLPTDRIELKRIEFNRILMMSLIGSVGRERIYYIVKY